MDVDSLGLWMTTWDLRPRGDFAWPGTKVNSLVQDVAWHCTGCCVTRYRMLHDMHRMLRDPVHNVAWPGRPAQDVAWPSKGCCMTRYIILRDQVHNIAWPGDAYRVEKNMTRAQLCYFHEMKEIPQQSKKQQLFFLCFEFWLGRQEKFSVRKCL